jgi:hypothetical protein
MLKRRHPKQAARQQQYGNVAKTWDALCRRSTLRNDKALLFGVDKRGRAVRITRMTSISVSLDHVITGRQWTHRQAQLIRRRNREASSADAFGQSDDGRIDSDGCPTSAAESVHLDAKSLVGRRVSGDDFHVYLPRQIGAGHHTLGLGALPSAAKAIVVAGDQRV